MGIALLDECAVKWGVTPKTLTVALATFFGAAAIAVFGIVLILTGKLGVPLLILSLLFPLLVLIGGGVMLLKRDLGLVLLLAGIGGLIGLFVGAKILSGKTAALTTQQSNPLLTSIRDYQKAHGDYPKTLEELGTVPALDTSFGKYDYFYQPRDIQVAEEAVRGQCFESHFILVLHLGKEMAFCYDTIKRTWTSVAGTGAFKRVETPDKSKSGKPLTKVRYELENEGTIGILNWPLFLMAK